MVPIGMVHGRDENEYSVVEKIYCEDIVGGGGEGFWVYGIRGMAAKKGYPSSINAVNKAPCETLELEEMQGMFQDMLEGKRFLIVLDDVWIEETTEWDKLCKPLIGGAKGSILVMSTRNHSSCRMLARIPEFQHQLRCLSEDNSWLFFKKLAFALGKGSEDENITELESIGKELVKRYAMEFC
ncbi:hypothetical protein OSB04_026535 [Centaurea solstitialis]|uniref:NB-ARC domain-containing protein n=1 Tax=Centaurea solstitialis TaxID=347529 RepID=A0AA38SBN0_9ASTR|nr:hypothetical protein OSB04_026535 [Centaurea solstitialis]